MGARRQLQASRRLFEKTPPGAVRRGVAAQQLRCERGVGGDPGSRQSRRLAPAGGADARRDRRAGVPLRVVRQLLRPERRHLDLQIEAVQERPGDPAAIARDGGRSAGAGAVAPAEMAAGAPLRWLSAMSRWEDANRFPAVTP